MAMAAVAVISGACFNPRFEYAEGQLACNEGACPPGYHCRTDNRCAQGNEADAAPGAADAALEEMDAAVEEMDAAGEADAAPRWTLRSSSTRTSSWMLPA